MAGITNRSFFPLDLVLYCEAFLTTYRTFITPEELIKKLQYRYPFPPPALVPTAHTSKPSRARRKGPCLLSPPAESHMGQRAAGTEVPSPALLCPRFGTSDWASSLSLCLYL